MSEKLLLGSKTVICFIHWKKLLVLFEPKRPLFADRNKKYLTHSRKISIVTFNRLEDISLKDKLLKAVQNSFRTSLFFF